MSAERDSSAAKGTGDWMTPFDGSGIEWHESLPSPYEYQESDFAKLCAAVHEYECALLEVREQLHRCRADYASDRDLSAASTCNAGPRRGAEDTSPTERAEASGIG